MEPKRPEKILLALYALAEGSTRPCQYEDIVVRAFELFPKDFQLRGYPQYPDSSDIHKPLYGPLKREGLIRATHKHFALTEKGLTRAEELASPGKGSVSKESKKRLSRDVEIEIERLVHSSAMQLFASGQKDKIIDTDFYSYVGVTVRTVVTKKNDYLGRLKAVSDAVGEAAVITPIPANLVLLELHKFLIAKFSPASNDKAGGSR